MFPTLLKKLLEKDFGSAIRSGFESTGIFPVNLERALSKLPEEDQEAETHVQQQLLNKLSLMRYNPGPTTHAKRPSNKEKLPAGASYTCSAEGGRVGLPDDTSDTGDSDESSSEEERSETVRNIIQRLSRKRPHQVEENELEQEEDDEDEDDAEEILEADGDQPQDVNLTQAEIYCTYMLENMLPYRTVPYLGGGPEKIDKILPQLKDRKELCL